MLLMKIFCLTLMISQQRNISSPVGGGQWNLRAENFVWLSPTGDTIRRRRFIEVLKLMVNKCIYSPRENWFKILKRNRFLILGSLSSFSTKSLPIVCFSLNQKKLFFSGFPLYKRRAVQRRYMVQYLLHSPLNPTISSATVLQITSTHRKLI